MNIKTVLNCNNLENTKCIFAYTPPGFLPLLMVHASFLLRKVRMEVKTTKVTAP
jgi:hypothetical protein